MLFRLFSKFTISSTRSEHLHIAGATLVPPSSAKEVSITELSSKSRPVHVCPYFVVQYTSLKLRLQVVHPEQSANYIFCTQSPEGFGKSDVWAGATV